MPGTSFGPGAANTIVFDRGTNIKFAEQADADVPITDPLRLFKIYSCCPIERL